MENSPNNPNWNPQSEPRRREHKGGAFWALVLIAIGIIFLVQNLHIANFSLHWWALFIFIPVLGSLSSAWNGLRQDGRFSAKVTGSLGSAVVVGTVGVILLFGMDWGRWWPLLIIAVGLSAFLTGLGRVDALNTSVLSALTRLSVWAGLAVMVLGMGFLVNSYPLPALQPYLAGYRWWAVPILIAGAGAFISAFSIFWENVRQMNWAAWSMLLIAVFITAIGLLALFALDWNLLFPIVLIACGLVILAGFLNRN